jgi:hypothetical protein
MTVSIDMTLSIPTSLPPMEGQLCQIGQSAQQAARTLALLGDAASPRAGWLRSRRGSSENPAGKARSVSAVTPRR